MKKSKKIFLIIAALFLLGVLVIAWDMSRRTTFPGKKNTAPADTVKVQDQQEYE